MNIFRRVVNRFRKQKEVPLSPGMLVFKEEFLYEHVPSSDVKELYETAERMHTYGTEPLLVIQGNVAREYLLKTWGFDDDEDQD